MIRFHFCYLSDFSPTVLKIFHKTSNFCLAFNQSLLTCKMGILNSQYLTSVGENKARLCFKFELRTKVFSVTFHCKNSSCEIFIVKGKFKFRLFHSFLFSANLHSYDLTLFQLLLHNYSQRSSNSNIINCGNYNSKSSFSNSAKFSHK